MARRVTILTTDPSELERACSDLSNAVVSGAVVVGDGDEQTIRQFEADGLLVTLIDEPEGPSPTPEPSGGDSADVYVVTLAGPVMEPWREALTDAGAELLSAIDRRTFAVRAPAAQSPVIAALDFVWAFRRYELDDTIAPADLSPAESTAEPILYDARVHPGVDAAEIASQLRVDGIEMVEVTADKLRFRAVPDSDALVALASRSEVERVQKFNPPEPACDRALALVGIPVQHGFSASAYNGTGEIVGLADSGIDLKHPDVGPRVHKWYARGRLNDPRDRTGHGTHIAGCIAGTGAASGGTVRGAAPGAKLVVHALDGANGGFTGLPADLGVLLEEAYAQGARIYNMSWSAADSLGDYQMFSHEVDAFVWRRPDMLVVVSAGNKGTAAGSQQAGWVKTGSVGSPGTAKNALTVGASTSDRKVAGNPTWGQRWPKAFPDPPIRDGLVSGGPTNVAAFSDRGPCDDGFRIKPDLLAPGTKIQAPRSRDAPAGEYETPGPSDPDYGFMSGTSMSAPIVAGSAALVRQLYRGRFSHTPSAALLKATLINGTRWLRTSEALADRQTPPNWHQGFGSLDLTGILSPPSGRRLAFRDTHSPGMEQLTATGRERRYTMQTQKAGPLRLCLTWIDRPGRWLHSVLTFYLEHTATRQRWLGDAGRPPAGAAWSTRNNVQVIWLDAAPAGTYRIVVATTSEFKPPQGFAVCVTGELTGNLVLAGP